MLVDFLEDRNQNRREERDNRDDEKFNQGKTLEFIILAFELFNAPTGPMFLMKWASG